MRCVFERQLAQGDDQRAQKECQRTLAFLPSDSPRVTYKRLLGIRYILVHLVADPVLHLMLQIYVSVPNPDLRSKYEQPEAESSNSKAKSSIQL